MKKTIARALMILGIIGGLGAATDLAEQEQGDFREIFGSQPAQTSSTISAPSQSPQFHIGTAFQLAVSGGLLGGAAAVNGRTNQAKRTDIERPIKLSRGQAETSALVRSINNSNRGLGTLISYLSDAGEISQAHITAVEQDGEITAVIRVVVEKGSEGSIETLFETIVELIAEKIDQAQHIALETKKGFEDSFAEAVAEEVKMGRHLVLKTLSHFKAGIPRPKKS
jgi:hypothetical protein